VNKLRVVPDYCPIFNLVTDSVLLKPFIDFGNGVDNGLLSGAVQITVFGHLKHENASNFNNAQEHINVINRNQRFQNTTGRIRAFFILTVREYLFITNMIYITPTLINYYISS
jgi:hypothetical protein